jgi:hypothetical protein
MNARFLVFALSAFIGIGACVAKENEQCPLKLSAGLDKDNELVVGVKNDGEEARSFYDSLRKEGVPAFLGFQISAPSRGVIASGESGGFLFPSMKFSKLIRLPVENGMATISPGESVARTLTVQNLIAGTISRWKVRPQDLHRFSIRFRLRVFCDEEFKSSVAFESDWFPQSSNALLLGETSR